MGDDETIRKKPRKIGVKKQSIVESDDSISVYESLKPNLKRLSDLQHSTEPTEKREKREKFATSTPLKLTFEPPKNMSIESIFETTEAPLEENFVIQAVQENPKALYNHMGPLR